jgi:hypothetical protein
MDDLTATRVSPITAEAAAERVTAFLRTVYGWITLFLILLRFQGGRRA